MAGTARSGLAVLAVLLLPACNLTYVPDQNLPPAGSGGPTGLFLPIDGAVNVITNPQFGWYAVDGATSYELQIAKDAFFSSMVWDEPGIFPETTILTQATLTNFTNFYWRVYATVSGVATPVLVDGSPFQFRTLGSGFTTPQAFTVQSPTGGIPGVDPSTLFTWTASAGAMSYTIEVDPSGTFSPAPISQSGIQINRGTLAGTLNKGTFYCWRVLAIGQLGNTYSDIGTFNTAP